MWDFGYRGTFTLVAVMLIVVEATIPALLGAALMIFGFWLKARFEDQFLSVELGAEAYRAYCPRPHAYSVPLTGAIRAPRP
jgi:protein-S-isoprenylcysteine O-methyltransferase Ste14